MEQRKIPDFSVTGLTVDHVSYMDGCKIYFTDGSFVICRPSGTEPVLRIMAETQDSDTTLKCINAFVSMLGLA